jgi:hypothetical protein
MSCIIRKGIFKEIIRKGIKWGTAYINDEHDVHDGEHDSMNSVASLKRHSCWKTWHICKIEWRMSLKLH